LGKVCIVRLGEQFIGGVVCVPDVMVTVAVFIPVVE
jgi:hypothetical protein